MYPLNTILHIFIAFAALLASVGLAYAYHIDDEEIQQAILFPVVSTLTAYLLKLFHARKDFKILYGTFLVCAFAVLSEENDILWEESAGRILDLFFERWHEDVPGSGWVRWYRIHGDDMWYTINRTVWALVTVAGLVIVPPVIRVLNAPLPDFDAPLPEKEPQPEKPKPYYIDDFDRYNHALQYSMLTGQQCPPLENFLDPRKMHDGVYFS
jgi:hypothetical protein